MGKNYDCNITPQNTRRFKQKKCVYFTVAGVFAITSLLITFLCPEDRNLGLAGITWAVLQSVMQMLEQRRQHWSWGYIIVMCAVMLCGSAVGIVLSGLYWCFALWVTVIVLCIALAIYDHSKKQRKR